MIETSVSHLQFPIERSKYVRGFPEKRGLFYRVLRHPLLRPYHRLAVTMVALNLLVYFHISESVSLVNHQISADVLQFLVLLNFGAGIFIRQQEVINFLFKMATSAPKHWPLSVRWGLAKVYHFGGIQVGGFIAGSAWLTVFVATSFAAPFQELQVPSLVRYMGVFHLVLLFAIMVVSLPQIRMPHHDLFERVARFGSWTSLLLFWYQSLHLIQSNNQNMLVAIILAPEVWALSYLTFCLAKPWFHLKRVPVNIVSPSGHVAISEFDYGVTPFAGSSTELSTSPFFEWHSFANIPTPNKMGFRLCISRAGDWTGEFIDKKLKSVWVKGIPTAGVGNIELLFKRVVWVATGSGIGPCLPHLIDKKVPSTLVWSTRSPRETYGNDLVDEILQVQPNTRIWDTTVDGRPDLVTLALEAYREFDAEAVIVISNKKLTFNVNYELESRGIPCFGAIWDS